MASNKMEFSNAGSERIQGEFTKASNPIREALQSVITTVETLRDWWEGDSAENFVKKNYEVKDQVEGELDRWLEANKNLIKKVEEILFAGDRAITY